MQFSTRKRRLPAINIVSLIDILCIVLIFFIVTTTFKREEPAIQIDLPESTQAKPTQEKPPTIIYVTKTGQVFLDDKPTKLEMLEGELRRRKQMQTNFKVALKASKEAPFGLIIKVMDAVKGAGLQQLPTFTEEPEKR